MASEPTASALSKEEMVRWYTHATYAPLSCSASTCKITISEPRVHVITKKKAVSQKDYVVRVEIWCVCW